MFTDEATYFSKHSSTPAANHVLDELISVPAEQLS
jgi:hypothetical protein